jgi:four helix bundle protein
MVTGLSLQGHCAGRQIGKKIVRYWKNILNNSYMKTHKDLNVWKDGISFVTKVYKITSSFPKEELYGITSQIRRAAVSIPSNIAEGAARKSSNEFKQFLYIALSSAAELNTQLIICNNLGFLNSDSTENLNLELYSISRRLQGLIRSLNS